MKIIQPEEMKPKVKKVANKEYKISKEIYMLAKERKIRHKYKVPLKEIVQYINDDPILSMNYHVYKQMLSKAGKSNLIIEWNLDDAIYDQETCASISDYAFKKGFKDYYYLVGIQTFYGWKEFDDIDAIRSKIKDWIQNSFEPKVNGSSQLFLNRFRAKIRLILRRDKEIQKQEVTAEEFIANIANTGTSGSAYDPKGPRLEVELDDVKIKVPNNKYAKSGALSEKEKLRRLKSMETGKASLSTKVEFFPKVRLIISSAYNMTMKMRFIDTWLTKWLHGSEFSTLFQTKQQTFKMWCEFAKENGWNLPIDQTKFDHNVSKAMVIIMLEEIKLLIHDNCTNNTELLEVMDTIIYGIKTTTVVWKHNNTTETFSYLSGILSGWQWTALLDSLANMAEVKMAEDLAKEKKIIPKIILLNVQGDDVALRTKRLIECLAIVVAMRSMGFLIHPSKTFFSKHHNEYLRKYYYKGVINGYPARMINGLLWVYPGEDLNLTLSEKLASTYSKWEKLAERLMIDTKKIMDHMKRDYKGLKINDQQVKDYLECSRLYGGAGIDHKPGKVSKVLETYSEDITTGVKIDDVGYKEFALRYGKDQSRELKMWFVKSINIIGELKSKKGIIDKYSIQEKGDPKPYKFGIIPSAELPKTFYDEKFPKNVIFGKSHDLLETAYPYIDTFTEEARAPKKWVYDYLSGHLKDITPKITKMSLEFSSLLWSTYRPSLINAMYYKTMIKDKWNSLQQYAMDNFEIVLDRVLETLPRMY